jgi:hypothetical protein
MRTIFRFVRYLVIRSLIMSAIGWGVAWYLGGDQLRSPYALRDQSIAALNEAARALRN